MGHFNDTENELLEIEKELAQCENEIKCLENTIIKIRAKCETQYGENIIVYSNGTNWDSKKPFLLQWTDGNIWVGDFNMIDFGTEYKLVIKSSTEDKWEHFQTNRKVLYQPNKNNEIVLNITYNKL